MQLLCCSRRGDALLGMPDIELLNILQINCKTIGTRKEEKSMQYNKNKSNAINVGSEQCCATTGPEKNCDKKDSSADSCTNTGSSLNSNNGLYNISLLMVKYTPIDYLLSWMTYNEPITIETNNRLNTFFQVQRKRMTKEQALT